MLDLSFLCTKRYERQHANRALSATLRYMTAMSKVIRELYWCVIHTNMKHSCQIRAGNINIFLIYGWLIAFSLASCYSQILPLKTFVTEPQQAIFNKKLWSEIERWVYLLEMQTQFKVDFCLFLLYMFMQCKLYFSCGSSLACQSMVVHLYKGSWIGSYLLLCTGSFLIIQSQFIFSFKISFLFSYVPQF